MSSDFSLSSCGLPSHCCSFLSWYQSAWFTKNCSVLWLPGCSLPSLFPDFNPMPCRSAKVIPSCTFTNSYSLPRFPSSPNFRLCLPHVRQCRFSHSLDTCIISRVVYGPWLLYGTIALGNTSSLSLFLIPVIYCMFTHIIYLEKIDSVHRYTRCVPKVIASHGFFVIWS